MNKLREYLTLYSIGSVGYWTLENLWRGFSHWSMAITGGVCYILLYHMNRSCLDESLVKRCIKGSLIITAAEFTVGYIVNLIFKMNVWDYSNLPFNVLGQICPLFTILWFLLCFPILGVANFTRKKLPNIFS